MTVGQAPTFSVTASGTVPLAYQWRRNGSNVGTSAATYTTPATTVADSGAVYSVVVSNAYGSATSAGAVLTVNAAAPTISYLPATETSRWARRSAPGRQQQRGGGDVLVDQPGSAGGAVLQHGRRRDQRHAERRPGAWGLHCDREQRGGRGDGGDPGDGGRSAGADDLEAGRGFLGGREVGEVDAAGVRVTLTDHLGSPRLLVRPRRQRQRTEVHAVRRILDRHHNDGEIRQGIHWARADGSLGADLHAGSLLRADVSPVPESRSGQRSAL